jgi:hypothetical protein
VVGLAVPAHFLEAHGVEGALQTVDRDLYPVDEVSLLVAHMLPLMLIDHQ